MRLPLVVSYVITLSCGVFVDVALEGQVGIADSLYNIQLILDFCGYQLPVRIAHLGTNDFFYMPEELKPALLVTLAEIFYWFEVQHAPCVRDVSKPYSIYMGMSEENGGTIFL